MSDASDSLNLINKIDMVFEWVSSNKMVEISQKLDANNNDTYLYMTAWRCWIVDTLERNDDGPLRGLGRNLYSLPDDADSWQEISGRINDLRQKARKAAMDAAEILENNYDLIEKSKSIRCMDMLVKSKWLCYTGYMPLEEKQLPKLSFEHWQELDRLCSKDIDYCHFKQVTPIPTVLFLHAIFLWVYGKRNKEARDLFKRTDSLLRPGRWFIERIGLCKTGTSEQREFLVDIIKIQNEKYTARVRKEKGEDPYSLLIGSDGIHLSNSVINYLLGKPEVHEQRGITKPVVIWFNAAGPTLGIPNKGGE